MTPLDFVFGIMVLAAICMLAALSYEYRQHKLEKIIARMQREEAERDFEESQKRQVREDFERECG